jgi:hypothetical protein
MYGIEAKQMIRTWKDTSIKMAFGTSSNIENLRRKEEEEE